MSKEAEEIKMLVVIHFGALGFFNPSMNDEILKDRDKVLKFIDRLEAIDNVEPSEALKCLDKLAKQIEVDEDTDFWEIRNAHKKVEQALLKGQKEHRALEIIKEKRIDLPYLRCCFEDNQNVERYNEYIRNKTMDYDHEEELTEEEFELLKEVLE